MDRAPPHRTAIRCGDCLDRVGETPTNAALPCTKNATPRGREIPRGSDSRVAGPRTIGSGSRSESSEFRGRSDERSDSRRHLPVTGGRRKQTIHRIRGRETHCAPDPRRDGGRLVEVSPPAGITRTRRSIRASGHLPRESLAGKEHPTRVSPGGPVIPSTRPEGPAHRRRWRFSVRPTDPNASSTAALALPRQRRTP